MAASDPDGDALAEAMSMLDAVNRGSQDLEDFAIDSDDDDANNLLDDLDLTNDLVDLGLEEVGDAAHAVDALCVVEGDFKGTNQQPGSVPTAQSGTNLSQPSGDVFVHPCK